MVGLLGIRSLVVVVQLKLFLKYGVILRVNMPVVTRHRSVDPDFWV